MVTAVASHRRLDGPGDDVSRREIGAWMYARHDSALVNVTKDGAFAPQSLGDQRQLTGCVTGEERGRMELHELHVDQRRSGP